jgi:hypothetical protein
MSVCIGVFLIAVTSWVAFGQESWHVERNLLEHRVGIGGLRKVRSYRDGHIAVTTYSNRWGRLFIRLFVVDGNGRHFLMERSPVEGIALADFVSRETGWKRVDVPPVTSTGLDTFAG